MVQIYASVGANLQHTGFCGAVTAAAANLFTLKKRVLMKQKHRKLKVLGCVFI